VGWLSDGGGGLMDQRPLTLQQAAGIAGVSPDTIARWCKRYGIGKHLHSKAPWRVDPEGLRIVMAGDSEALASYNRDRNKPISQGQHECNLL
jgi:hypothetical protein